MQSRNKREGKFIPGFCINPSPKNLSKPKQVRAGEHFDLKKGRNLKDGSFTIPGLSFVRFLREGAYQ